MIRRLPSRFAIALVRYVLPVVIVLRSLFGSLLGVAILSSLLYCFMWNFSETRPFTLAQLALWLDELPSEAKTSFITVVLTVLGFLVAFHTATANWKAETQARMKMDIADQIEMFFSEVLRLSDKTTIFAERLVTAVENIREQGRSAELDFQVSYAFSKSTEFLATRDRLTELSVQVHRIGSRHGATLLSVWGGLATLYECADALSEMSEAMWVRVPVVVEHNPNPVEEVVRQLDAAEYKALLICFEKNKARISALSGALRGQLLQPLTVINFAWVAGFRTPLLRSALSTAIEKVRRDTK